MQYGYIVKISNKNIYREVQLPVDAEIMKVGMSIDCDARFYKESFFEDFELVFRKQNGVWHLSCSENLYIDAGDVRKLLTKELAHGDSFSIKYQNSESELFKIDFLFDFDNENKDYSRGVNVSTVNNFYIGNASNCNIVLNSEYVKNDLVEFSKKPDGSLVANIKATTYGLYHNGSLAKNGEVIKNGDFFSIADFSFYYKNGVVCTSRSVKVNSLNYFDEQKRNSYPKFNKNTRVKVVVDDEKIEVLDPPAKPQKQKNNIFTRLLPSLAMIVGGLAMGAFMPIMALSSLAGVATAIISLVQSKKDFKTNSAERIEKYNNYINNKRKEIEQYRLEEKNTLDDIYYSQDVIKQEFSDFSSDLFDRTPEDDDFLTVRLGTGSREAIREVTYKKQERLEIEDDLQTLPEKICEEYKNVNYAPIVCSFKDSNAIGVIGAPENRYEIMKNMIIDICGRQYHSDVKMFLVVEGKNVAKTRWLRMLPHLYNEEIGIRNIVCDDDSKNILFEYLYKELSVRKEKKDFKTQIVIFLYDEFGFKNHPLSKFIDDAKDLGVTFVFFGDKKADVSQGCNYLIDIQSNNSATLIDTSDRSKSLVFEYNAVSDALAASIVNLLAPVYTEEISLEGSLTKNISMFKLLNILAVDDIDLTSRWNSSQVFKSMAAPIGVSKNSVISLDLHDKAHGPHGLVAGTTGSGKSEILQTYILSMATLFHPYEVGFVIIDFKGGGMVNQFKDLPHLMGAITNIDGKEINRSLKSIKAELQKRQRLFADADVNHIDKYIKKYKAGEVSEPLPHLIVIVDEFAELKAEQPDFMKELISAARIGRSLGVHLILATQKPSGQVNEQIWSNSRFKLCLKVQDQQDSNEVLKSPLAAEIKEPGRAYLQVGNNEIFELFQSAYSGAPEKADNSNVKEFKIYALNNSGRKIPVFEQKKKKSGDGDLTQLDALVKYIHNYCENNRINKLPDICLPSLSNIINFPSNEELLEKDYSVSTEIGIYDDPDNQYQGTYSVDLANQNVMIIGSAQSGKTNILQTMIRSIATKYTPDEVTIYIMDFASMVLKNYESLNHVGGVVTSSEDEKLKNLMKLLFTEIETRKEKLMSVGVSSFSAYKEAGMTDLPQIVLMIDNLTALKELYFEDDEELLSLCREGLSVGITVVIANSQTSGIGYKYLSNFSARIALFCNDSGEYSSLFEHCRETVEDIHGRCIVEIDKAHLDCQTFLAFEGEKEIDRVNEIKKFISAVNSKNEKSVAKIIPVIPAILNSQIMKTQYLVENNINEFVLGLNYDTVKPISVSLQKQDLLVLSGNNEEGIESFVNYLKSTLLNNIANTYVLDDYTESFIDVSRNDNTVLYSKTTDDLKEILTTIRDELAKRYTKRELMGASEITDLKPIVFMVNNKDAIDCISNNNELLSIYKEIVKKYKGLKSLIIFTKVENTSIMYSSPEVLKMIKEDYNVLFFDNLSEAKLFDCTPMLLRKYKKPVEIGDAFFISGNEITKLKTVSN